MSDETTYPTLSANLGRRTITTIDCGTIVQIVITGSLARVSLRKLVQRIVFKGRVGFVFSFTSDAVRALYLLLEETETVKQLLEKRKEHQTILRERRDRLRSPDPGKPQWECS